MKKPTFCIKTFSLLLSCYYLHAESCWIFINWVFKYK